MRVWAVLCAHSLEAGEVREKIYVGERPPVRCRLCLKKRPEVTFRKQAHVIPASLGNRSLFCSDECDVCNSRFGEELDDALVRYLSPVRAISRLPGRSGFPKHKLQKHDSFIKFDDRTGFLNIKSDSDGKESAVSVQDNGDGHLSIKIRKQPYKLINVVKAITRLMLLGQPQITQEFESLRQWVCGERVAYGVRICSWMQYQGGRQISLLAERCMLANYCNAVRVVLGYPYMTTLISLSLDSIGHSGIHDNDLFEGLVGRLMMKSHDYRIVIDDATENEGWIDFDMSYERRHDRSPLPKMPNLFD